MFNIFYICTSFESFLEKESWSYRIDEMIYIVELFNYFFSDESKFEMS